MNWPSCFFPSALIIPHPFALDHELFQRVIVLMQISSNLIETLNCPLLVFGQATDGAKHALPEIVDPLFEVTTLTYCACRYANEVSVSAMFFWLKPRHHARGAPLLSVRWAYVKVAAYVLTNRSRKVYVAS